MVSKLLPLLLVVFASYSTFAEKIKSSSKSSAPLAEYDDAEYLPKDEIPEQAADETDYAKIERSWNRQNFGYPTPYCPNSDTLQSIMKILLHLLKQQKNPSDTSNVDKLRQAIALYKRYLLTSKFSKENLALLNKLIKMEKILKNNDRKEDGAKITVTFELPVPSHPRCLNALEYIVSSAHNAYARLKLNDICKSNIDFDDRTSSVSYPGNGALTLQDVFNSDDNTPLSGDPDKIDPETKDFDMYNLLNNYRPKEYKPNSQNKQFINSDLLSQLFQDLKLKDPKQPPPDQNDPYIDDNDRYKDILISLLNSKQKKSTTNSIDSQDDLLSLVLNKFKNKENKNPWQDQRPFNVGPNSNLNSILQSILETGNGHLGPSDGVINMQHIPNFEEGNPTQDILSHLLPDSTLKPKPKLTYPNPLQDPPLSLEAVETPLVDSNFNEPSLINPNVQDLNSLEFDQKYSQKPSYDTTALNRILDKLKYATALAKNLNKLKKKQNQHPVLKQYNGPFSNDFLSLSSDQNPYNPYDEDKMNTNYYSYKFPGILSEYPPYFDPIFEDRIDKRPGEPKETYNTQSNIDVSGEENVYKLMTSPNQSGVLELTYLLNRPTPTAEPFYFVKYKIPYETFVLNFNKLLREQSFRPRTPDRFYKDLLAKCSTEIVDSSSALRSALNVNIIDQVLRSGTLLGAKVVNDNSTRGFVEITVKALPNDEEVKSLIDVLDHETLVEKKNSYPRIQTNRIKPNKDYSNRRKNNLKNFDDDLSASSLPSIDELRNKLKEIWSPDLLNKSRSDDADEDKFIPSALIENKRKDNKSHKEA